MEPLFYPFLSSLKVKTMAGQPNPYEAPKFGNPNAGRPSSPVFAVIRFVYSTLAGIALAVVLFIAVEMFGMVAHPFPDGFDMQSKEAMYEYILSYPTWVLAVAVLMWLGLAFGSTWVAARLGNLIPGIAVGALLIMMFGCNVLSLPYPTWFSATVLIGFPIMVALALLPYIWPATAKPVLA